MGASGCPLYIHTTPCLYAPWGANMPTGSHTPLCICMIWEAFACCWLHVGHLPYMLDTSTIWGMPPHVLHPPLIGWLLCASVCLGYICMLYGEYSLHVGGWGSIPHMWGFGGIYTPDKLWCLAVHPLGVHYALSCTFSVVHYVSPINHSYEYYSSSYGGVLWSVIYFIGDHGPFLDGASCNIGSA